MRKIATASITFTTIFNSILHLVLNSLRRAHGSQALLEHVCKSNYSSERK
jgi:hypothetical protein